MASLWQDARTQQQQYALQTLPQHLRQAAHDHTSNTSDDDDGSSGSDESESSESDVGSNQLDACESLGASSSSAVVVVRRKALLVQQEQNAALLQRRRMREAVSTGSNAGAVVTAAHDGEVQQHNNARVTHRIQRRQSPPRQPLERKNSTRSTGAIPDAQRFDLSAAAVEAALQQRSSSAVSLSALQSAVSSAHTLPTTVEVNSYQSRRKTSVSPISEAAIQDEIRTMIAQTEQLLTSALQQPQPYQQLVQQGLQPQPPQPSTLLRSSSPLRSSRLISSEIVRRASVHQDDSSNNRDDQGTVLELMQQGDIGEIDHNRGEESTEAEEEEEEADSVFSDESSEQEDDRETEHERDELSDGEMYPSSSGLMFGQQSMQQQSMFMSPPPPHQSQDTGYHSIGRVRDDDENEGLSDLQLDEEVSTTNRDINASKARALKESMAGNLIRLGFKENLTRMALDAGVQEIDHYDLDCELAYVDIFMSLVKMVCDAHLDSFSHRSPPHPHWMSPPGASSSEFAMGGGDLIPLYSQGSGSGSSHQTAAASLPFKWPVFDMAQFEFGNARTGTCFDSVCVLTNLPKVSMDRTEELMEILSCNLFCMIGDPIQVVIPSVSATGRTKGHAFLEFDDHQLAKACAAAIDGLTWGRGPFGCIRSSMFRQYQVKSPTAPQTRFDGLRTQDAIGARMTALDTSTSSSTDPNDSGHAEYSHFDDDTISGDRGTSAYFPDEGRLRSSPFATSSGSRNTPSYPLFGNRSLDPFPGSPLYTSSEDGGDDDEDDGDLLWQGTRPTAPRVVSISEMGDSDAEFGGHDTMTIRRRHSFADSIQSLEPRAPDMFDLNDSQFSSDADDEDEHGFGFGGNGVEVETWGMRDPDALLQYEAADETLTTSRRLMQSHGDHTRPPHPLIDVTSQALSSQLQEARSGIKAQSPSQRPPQQNHLNSELPDADEATQTDESEKPWRSYCEELIARNREMQEQVAYARRRIVQLGHNNQKLHLLVDRVERDRDGLMFENDLLQNQLNGFEDHERHHEALLTELTILRKRMRKNERGLKGGSSPTNGSYLASAPSLRGGHDDDDGFQRQARNGHVSASLEDVRFVLHHQLGPNALNVKNVEELKDWEQLLESSLARVRAMKEEKALALQKKLDRQVEEQQELKLCVICLSNEKSILCLPCRHLCLCESCSAHEEVEKCPICRLHIDEMLLVYA